jgi:hypothetical protein
MANGKRTAAAPESGTEVPESGTVKAEPKAWRAKEACTFGGKFVKQGEIVFAGEMKNPHFEKVE